MSQSFAIFDQIAEMGGSLELFDALKSRFGESEARVIVKEIENIETNVQKKVETIFADKKDILATKNDIFEIKQEISQLRIEMERGFKDNLKWTVGIIMACTGLIVTLVKIL